MKTFVGIGASHGIATGRLYHFNNRTKHVEPSLTEDTCLQLARFDRARRQVIAVLEELYQKALKVIGPKDSMIFEIHQLLLEDLDYIDFVNDLIKMHHFSAEYAVQCASEQFASIFSEMEDAYMKERSADIIDISNQILRLLCGETTKDLSHVQGQFVLAAQEFLPSETFLLDSSKVMALITSAGSRVSHAAILARTMGIPSVVGLGNDLLESLQDGDVVRVDGYRGMVQLMEPDEF